MGSLRVCCEGRLCAGLALEDVLCLGVEEQTFLEVGGVQRGWMCGWD